MALLERLEEVLYCTVFEYDTISLGALSTVERTDVLKAIEALPKPKGQEVLRLIVKQGYVALQSTQFVGLYQLGPLRLQVLPKCYRLTANGPEAQRQAVQNLFVMLRYALDAPVHLGNTTEMETGADWFETLTTLFTESLLAEWRRGPIRRYESKNDNLSSVRGRFRVIDHIRQVGRQHVLPVTHDEFVSDTALNHIFRFVVECLRHLSRNARNQERLRTLSNWMDEDGVNLLPTLDMTHALNLRLDRMHARYEFAFTLAQIFLRSEGLITHNGHYRGQAMFFDMNTLFEGFLTGILNIYRKDIFAGHPHNINIISQGNSMSKSMFTRKNDGEGVLYLKPDIIIHTNGKPSVILDFKYKILQPDQIRFGVKREDLYQIFSYAKRYESKINVLIYPYSANIDWDSLQLCIPNCEEMAQEVRIGKVDVFDDLNDPKSIARIIEDLRECLSLSETLREK